MSGGNTRASCRKRSVSREKHTRTAPAPRSLRAIDTHAPHPRRRRVAPRIHAYDVKRRCVERGTPSCAGDAGALSNARHPRVGPRHSASRPKHRVVVPSTRCPRARSTSAAHPRRTRVARRIHVDDAGRVVSCAGRSSGAPSTQAWRGWRTCASRLGTGVPAGNASAASPRGRFDGATHHERGPSPPVRGQHAVSRIATPSLHLTEKVSFPGRACRRHRSAVTALPPGTVAFLAPGSPPDRDIGLPRLRRRSSTGRARCATSPGGAVVRKSRRSVATRPAPQRRRSPVGCSGS